MIRTVRITDDMREAATRLQAIPNVGPAIAADLMRPGILGAEDAAGRDPDELYARLCALDGVRHDPCVRDVFEAAMACAGGVPAQPWRVHPRRRKARERERGRE
jgi:hypothetical protein